MLALVLFAVLLHGSSLAAGNLVSAPDQLANVFGWGELLGALFAALLGAMSITGEIRHGTIRPTFLVTPRRHRVVAAKVGAGDYARLVAGGAAATALWAVIGVGIGAVLRNQVPALVGICAWILFVENVLVGDIGGVGNVGRLLPGAAGKAVSGRALDTPLSPPVGLVLLALYAAAAAVAGSLAISRRDVA